MTATASKPGPKGPPLTLIPVKPFLPNPVSTSCAARREGVGRNYLGLSKPCPEVLTSLLLSSSFSLYLLFVFATVVKIGAKTAWAVLLLRGKRGVLPGRRRELWGFLQQPWLLKRSQRMFRRKGWNQTQGGGRAQDS